MIYNKHIIIVGFKHVGKSTIAKALIPILNRACFDLDHEIENEYFLTHQERLTCRQIFIKHGEMYFRNSEATCLAATMTHHSSIIALGGGACLSVMNQEIIKNHFIIHLQAEPWVIYQRIIENGVPAFFPHDKSPEDFFIDLWNEREKYYQKLAHFSVDNTYSIEDTIQTLRHQLVV